MRRMLCLVGLLAIGCNAPPASLVPLARDSDYLVDQRIVGQWQLASARPQPERGRIITVGSLDDVVATSAPDAASHYSLVLRKKDKNVRLTLALCEIGDNLYVSLQHPPVEDAALARTTLRPYFLAKCTIADGQIRLSACKSQQF